MYPSVDGLEGNETIMTETGHSKALFYVLTAGMLWSFGALTIRYMVDPQNYRWQYAVFVCNHSLSRCIHGHCNP
jgi:hypothetical protein